MKQQLIKSILFLCLHLVTFTLSAQVSGSVSTYGGVAGVSAMSISNGGTTADVGETLNIGPGDYTINGTWEIYSKNVWISPDAVISGTGTMVFYNPSVAGGSSGPTLIDGNGSSHAIDVNIQLENASGMQLTQITADASLTGAGWTDVTTVSTVYIGADIDLAVDGANISLGTVTAGDLVFDTDATISNYSVSRMVITNNSVLSHMVKEDAGSTMFVFPVGIAPGDYTPASISSSSVQDIYVSVTDYSATSATIEAPQEGMDRAWHIYGSAAQPIDASLQHNNVTDGTSYSDIAAFITQYEGGNIWSTSASSDYVSAGLHTKSGLAIVNDPTGVGSWFTKASDAVTPLPVQLIRFAAVEDQCAAAVSWVTGTERNFDHFELERSFNGSSYAMIARIDAKGDNSTYNYLDAGASEGDNYYRLKMVDGDGSSTYSDIAPVSISCGSVQLLLYPNPTQAIITIEGLKGTEQVKVTDVLGRVMKEAKANGSILQVDLGALADAAYNVIVISNNSIMKTFKIIKKD